MEFLEEVSKKKGFSSKPAEWLFLFVINAGQGVRHGQAYDCPLVDLTASSSKEAAGRHCSRFNMDKTTRE